MRDRTNSLVAIFLLFFLSISALLQAEEFAYYRVANLVAAGEGNANFSLDGKDIYKKGYKTGQSSGVVATDVGSHVFSVAKEGCETGAKKLKLTKDQTISVIAYAVKEFDKKTKENVWKIKVGALKASPREKGATLTVVSFLPRSQVRLALKREGAADVSTIKIEGRKPESVKLGSFRGSFQLSLEEKELLVSNFDGNGEIVVLLYEDAEGNIATEEMIEAW